MKKSSFSAMILGTISGLLFSLGMCMALITEWNAFKPGVAFGCVGLALAIVTFFIWRKMEHKAPINVSGKTVCTIIVGIAGTLSFGVGMCFCMVWSKMILGIAVGLIGIGILFCLVPLTRGLKD